MNDPTDYASLIMVKALQGQIARANAIPFNDKSLRLVCWNCWDVQRLDPRDLPHYDNWSSDEPENTPEMLCPVCQWMDPWVWGPFGKYGRLFA